VCSILKLGYTLSVLGGKENCLSYIHNKALFEMWFGVGAVPAECILGCGGINTTIFNVLVLGSFICSRT
jgi:hypothetical protein